MNLPELTGARMTPARPVNLGAREISPQRGALPLTHERSFTMNQQPARSFSARRMMQCFAVAGAMAVVSLAAACSRTTVTESSTTTRTESPLAVYRALYEAGTRDDLEGIKSRLSAGTLRMFEKRAQDEGITLNDGQKSVDLIKKTLYIPKKMPEIGNEKIAGDTATIDISGVTSPFVKEGGEWKLALDKFF
jgi:hypothetical protein